MITLFLKMSYLKIKVLKLDVMLRWCAIFHSSQKINIVPQTITLITVKIAMCLANNCANLFF